MQIVDHELLIAFQNTLNTARESVKLINAPQINAFITRCVFASEITPCNKIDKPLVVQRFSENVMTSITALRT